MGKAKDKDKAKRQKWFGSKTNGSGMSAIVINKVRMSVKEHWVSFMPKHFIGRLTKDHPIISIGSRGEYANLDGFDNTLRLTLDVSELDDKYNPERVTKEKVRDVIQFVCKNYDKPILVHCNEGMCRSPAIAEAIAFCFTNIRLNFDFAGCKRNYYGDPGLTRSFIRIFDEVSNEIEMINLINEYEAKIDGSLS